MTFISLVFLFVYLFGAYAYGAATVYGFRQIGPIWGGKTTNYPPGLRARMDKAGLALFAISTVWFVLHVLVEFRNFIGFTHESVLDLGTLMVYLFPPVIMHTVYLESQSADEPPPPALDAHLLHAMYVISPLLGVYMVAAIFDKVPHPHPLGLWIGVSIGSLFTLTSLYATALMLRRKPAQRTRDQIRLRNVMIGMFIALSGVFFTLVFMREQQLTGMILERVAKSSPIFFMIASVYFENRFEFYDLVVKRAVLMLVSLFVLGVFLAITLPWMRLFPVGAAQPWLFAVALAPVAMVMPWLCRTDAG